MESIFSKVSIRGGDSVRLQSPSRGPLSHVTASHAAMRAGLMLSSFSVRRAQGPTQEDPLVNYHQGE